MTKDTLPAKRLKNALTKLQDAQSALKLAAEELAIVDADMIGSDAHRRVIVEASKDDPIKTADDIESHRSQAAEIAQAAADVGKLAKDAERSRIEVTLRALTEEELERKPEHDDERCHTCGRSDGE